MVPLTILVACSFLACLILTPVLSKTAIFMGWLDFPDFQRKLHSTPVPRIGGMALMLAYLGALAVVRVVRPDAIAGAMPLLTKLLPATFVMFLVGLLDDVVGLRPYQKLAGQFAAALMICLTGLRIHSLAGHSLGDVVGPVLTLIWLAGCTNAFNLIDGVDGVASGIGFCATATTMIVALHYNDGALVLAAAPLGGVLLAFLIYNFKPASIFLGDCGSLWVGFLIASFCIIWFQKADSAWSLTAPIMAFYVPLLDTALAIVRRFLRGQPIFHADRAHIHHRLLDRGLPPRRVAYVFYVASGVGAIFALLQTRITYPLNAGLILLFCVGVAAAIRYLQYQEFQIFVRVLREARLRLRVQSHISLRAFQEDLCAASDPEECWQALRALKSKLGFSTIALHLAGCRYREGIDAEEEGRWNLRIPLSSNDFVNIGCHPEYHETEMLNGAVALQLHRALAEKAAQFRRVSNANTKAHPQLTT